MNFNLAHPFFRQAEARPEGIALWIEGQTWTYAELRGMAQRIAGWLGASGSRQPARVGILASRTLETYAGILGASWSGAAYFPISTKLPAARITDIIHRSQLDALIVDKARLDLLSPEMLQSRAMRVLAPECDAIAAQSARCGIRIESFDALPPFDADDEPSFMDENALAYVIFTSGTTGVPKGVMISTGNVRNFIHAIQDRYRFQPDDRVAQPSEVSFDNSVFDLFNCWEAGAALYVVPQNQLLGPVKFLRENAITVWYSVPSFAVAMQRMKMLRPGSLPALRYSAFAGEALPHATAEAWRMAASRSIVDCLYGPTETTVVCTGDRYSDEAHVTESRGIISIGKPFPGMEAIIVDPELRPLSPGQAGELAFCGKQVAIGYLGDEAQTLSRFPQIDGRRWYLTGDLAVLDESGRYHHMGRVDNQVKISGNRVELEEVEAQLRVVLGSDTVAAVAWPMQHGTADKLIAFVSSPARPLAEASDALKDRLPPYMIPARIHQMDEMPMNVNGKIDRKALYRMLDENLIQ